MTKSQDGTLPEPVAKKAKFDDATSSPCEDVETSFSDNLFSKSAQIADEIANSGPYKHGVIRPLVNDELLQKVRKEIESELHFTKKETDIYKVFQTGDLANISRLDPESMKRLESLAKLRDALYSQEFRDFLSKVTNSGPLSGIKKDLSINVYQKGCHLLNHDDVIGTRRISYILYLVDKPWHARWGGSLRLFPVVKPGIPATDWELTIPPAWNQLAFFTVQPGISFHDVEEVFVDKPRLSISGWFHVPQEGEPGYQKEHPEAEKMASLKQLEVLDPEFDFPKRTFDPVVVEEEEEEGNTELTELSNEDWSYLSKYLNPKICDKEYLKTLGDQFVAESSIVIQDFLNPEYAELVKTAIDDDDLAEMPKKSTEVVEPWHVARPPHKARYLYVEPSEALAEASQKGSEEPNAFSRRSASKLAEISEFFKSIPYLKWLKVITSLTPQASYSIGRRFRPGYDFTLATNHDNEESYLEGILCLTPSKGWLNGELGGYDLGMSGEGDSFDPAVYRGGSGADGENGETEEDDDVLIENQVSWNTFSLIVRDKGILRFIKYVSKSAPGSRWDVAGEWGFKEHEEEDEEEDEEEGENGEEEDEGETES